MKKIAFILLLVTFVIPQIASAQKKKGKVKVKVEIEIDLDDLKAQSEVPITLDEARQVGATEAEIHKGYAAMKTVYVKGRPSLRIAQHFKKTAEAGYSDEGLGDVIRECIARGMRDEALVRCVLGKTTKKKRKRPHPVVKAIPKTPVLPPKAMKPAIVTKTKTPPPPRLKKEAEHVAGPTGARKGKKLGPKKLRKK